MTNYKTHTFFGIMLSAIAYFFLYYYFNYPLINYVFYLPLIIMYSQLPDIDHQNSMIYRIMTFFMGIILVLSLAVYIVAKENIFILFRLFCWFYGLELPPIM